MIRNSLQYCVNCNSKYMLNLKSGSGFTLAEILVVIAILAVFGAVIVGIFSNTLKGSSKSQIMAVIKQNGQAVLENMDKTIRGSDNVVCITLSGATIIVVGNDGIYTRYRFVIQSGSLNGYILQDKPFQQVPDPTKPTELETDAAFAARVCSDTDIMDQTTQVATLTDTNTQSGVSVKSGLFAKPPQPGFKDSITISFILESGTGVTKAVASQVDPVTFQTTIQLR